MEHLNLKGLGDDFSVDFTGNNYTEEDHFHGFPESQGWEFNPTTYELLPKVVVSGTGTYGSAFQDLMQSWLFFGLIAAVVYDDNSSGRTFDWNRLRENSKISTAQLPKILEEWRDWETNPKNREGQNLRLIRAQLALDVARNVIKNNSAKPGDDVQQDMQLVPELALCLMVLGETLTNAKAKIIEQVGFRAREWYGDASIGWGSPSAVLRKMIEKGWCPRTQRLLRAQLHENATALVSVYAAHHDFTFQGHKEAGCKEDVPCKLKPEINGKYATKHQPNCLHRNCNPTVSCARREQLEKDKKHVHPTCYSCEQKIGVTIEKVIEIIENDEIPLFTFKSSESNADDPIQLDVVSGKHGQDYATISHVWSDGYGNPNENKLWRCQLAYFRDLLKEAQMQKNRKRRSDATQPLPFWIDTLAIPVGREYNLIRKKAISHIYKIYSRAKYTIVIDNGLNNMLWDPEDQNYTTTALRILASGWMRRLWTLQEAYLSRRLLFAFKHKNKDTSIPLIDLDEIEELYIENDDQLFTSLPRNARSYYHNMLGQDRKARIHGLSSNNGVGLVASVWKAAQWRTTSKLEHETLAIATLLNLDYQSTNFADAKLLEEHQKDEKLNHYMREFWQVLEDTSPGAIPPGIIFLPGDKIKIQGFGWAPLSWLRGQEVDYPDPLSIVDKSAQLLPDKGGLLVEYPGFVLHCEDRNEILSTTNMDGFWFTSDSTLTEWYHVKRADTKDYSTKRGVIDKRRSEKLAIILSRPRPREEAEIGLLVEIYREREYRQLGQQHSNMSFGVYIRRRVKVRRETDEARIKTKRAEIIRSRKLENRDKIICGEALADTQQWYVDSAPPDPNPNDVNDERDDFPTEINNARVMPYPYELRGGSVAGAFETQTGAFSTNGFASRTTPPYPLSDRNEVGLRPKRSMTEGHGEKVLMDEDEDPKPGLLKRLTGFRGFRGRSQR